MAKLLMGAIVTKAVGKLGGHCFRLHGSTQVLQRTAYSANHNTTVVNPSMNLLRTVFGLWSFVPISVRKDWGKLANDNPTVDRFGNPKILSARGFYTRSQIALLMAEMDMLLPSDFRPAVPPQSVTSILINTNSSVFDLTGVLTPTFSTLRISVRLAPSSFALPSAQTFSRFASMRLSAYSPTTLFTEISGNQIILQPERNYAVCLFFVSQSGISSPRAVFNVLAI